MQGEEISRNRIGEMSSKEFVKIHLFSTTKIGRFDELCEGKSLGTIVVHIQVPHKF